MLFEFAAVVEGGVGGVVAVGVFLAEAPPILKLSFSFFVAPDARPSPAYYGE